MSTIDLNKIQRNVLEVCREFPKAVDDDAALLDLYWHKFCAWDDSKSLYWNLSRVTRSETIFRRRREIREAGLISHSEQETARRSEAMHNEQERATPGKAMSWLDD